MKEYTPAEVKDMLAEEYAMRPLVLSGEHTLALIKYCLDRIEKIEAELAERKAAGVT